MTRCKVLIGGESRFLLKKWRTCLCFEWIHKWFIKFKIFPCWKYCVEWFSRGLGYQLPNFKTRFDKEPVSIFSLVFVVILYRNSGLCVLYGDLRLFLNWVESRRSWILREELSSEKPNSRLETERAFINHGRSSLSYSCSDNMGQKKKTIS